MAIYIDDAKIKFRHMKMCHMIADSDAELMEFAKRLGLLPEWKHKDHFDVCISKRDRAIELGAIEITQVELSQKVIRQRGQGAHKKSTLF